MTEYFNNREKVHRLQEIVNNKLIPLIKSDYVLLDVPNYANIGDNLIWEGELEFLKKIPFKKLYSANLHNIEINKIDKASTILFNGGGNFGDLYSGCQGLRINIIQNYRNKRIIVFPQTVYYKDISILEKESIIYNNHPDLYICLRDQVSFDTLAKYIKKDKLMLLPDMAFFINFESFHKSESNRKALIMNRTDIESIDSKKIYEIKKSIAKNITYKVSDWPSYSNIKFINFITQKFVSKKNSLSIMFQHNNILQKFVDPEFGLNSKKSRTKYIQQGVSFMNNYDIIYSTRLHGVILAILLNKEVYIVDNNYGKSRNYYNTWLSDFDKVHLL